MSNKTKKMDNSGFTLIELIVVLVIIAILTSITLIAINPAKHFKETNDAKRISEIMALQTALNAAIINGHIDLSFCNNCNSTNGTVLIDGTGWIKFNNISRKGLGDFITTLPQDNLNSGENIYKYYSDGTNYELNAKFESQKYSGMAELDGGNDNTVYERGTNLLLK